MATDLFEPDPVETALAVRPADAVLDSKLTGKTTVDALAAALRDAAFEFDPDDLITIATADELKIEDAAAYERGFELLHELGALEQRVTSHYGRFDKPLNFLIGVVRELKGPQVASVTPIKKALAVRLGTWKTKADEADRLERERQQAIADAVARTNQEQRAQTLDRVAKEEADPALAQSFRQEAEMVRSAPVHAAPVEVKPTAPKVARGATRAYWHCEFDNLKELLTAYVEGRCFLDEEAIKDALQSSMDRQATNLQENLGKAFPGTRAVKSTTAIARRR
jgi:hypothetical protein